MTKQQIIDCPCPRCTRRDMIVTHAWEIWTKNGLNLDHEAKTETEKSVQDAVANTYTDDLTDQEWLTSTLQHLLGRVQP